MFGRVAVTFGIGPHSSLSVSNFAEKLLNGFAWNFQGRLAIGQWTNDYISVAIRVTVWIQGWFSGFVTIVRYRKWLTDINLLLILIRQYGGSGKTCLDRGMHYPSASSFICHCFELTPSQHFIALVTPSDVAVKGFMPSKYEFFSFFSKWLGILLWCLTVYAWKEVVQQSTSNNAAKRSKLNTSVINCIVLMCVLAQQCIYHHFKVVWMQMVTASLVTLFRH